MEGRGGSDGQTGTMKAQGGCGTQTSDGLTQRAALRKGWAANTAVHQGHEADLR